MHHCFNYSGLKLTGIRQVQVCSAGGEHPGVDTRDDVGLVHDEVHDVVVCSQLTLRAKLADIKDVKGRNQRGYSLLLLQS